MRFQTFSSRLRQSRNRRGTHTLPSSSAHPRQPPPCRRRPRATRAHRRPRLRPPPRHPPPARAPAHRSADAPGPGVAAARGPPTPPPRTAAAAPRFIAGPARRPSAKPEASPVEAPSVGPPATPRTSRLSQLRYPCAATPDPGGAEEEEEPRQSAVARAARSPAQRRCRAARLRATRRRRRRGPDSPGAGVVHTLFSSVRSSNPARCSNCLGTPFRTTRFLLVASPDAANSLRNPHARQPPGRRRRTHAAPPRNPTLPSPPRSRRRRRVASPSSPPPRRPHASAEAKPVRRRRGPRAPDTVPDPPPLGPQNGKALHIGHHLRLSQSETFLCLRLASTSDRDRPRLGPLPCLSGRGKRHRRWRASFLHTAPYCLLQAASSRVHLMQCGQATKVFAQMPGVASRTSRGFGSTIEAIQLLSVNLCIQRFWVIQFHR